MTLAEAARALVGTPFRHLGRSAQGVDCAGLVFLAAWSCGLQVPDFIGYGQLPDPQVLLRELGKRAEQVGADQPAEVAVFHYRRGDGAHFGVLDGAHLIHAYGAAGRVVRTPIGRWIGRLHSRWVLRRAA